MSRVDQDMDAIRFVGTLYNADAAEQLIRQRRMPIEYSVHNFVDSLDAGHLHGCYLNRRSVEQARRIDDESDVVFGSFLHSCTEEGIPLLYRRPSAHQSGQ